MDNDSHENFNLGLKDIDSYEIFIIDTYYSSQAALRKTTFPPADTVPYSSQMFLFTGCYREVTSSEAPPEHYLSPADTIPSFYLLIKGHVVL